MKVRSPAFRESLFVLIAALSVQMGAVQLTTGVPGSLDETRTVDGRYLPNPQPAFDGIINLNVRPI